MANCYVVLLFSELIIIRDSLELHILFNDEFSGYFWKVGGGHIENRTFPIQLSYTLSGFFHVDFSSPITFAPVCGYIWWWGVQCAFHKQASPMWNFPLPYGLVLHILSYVVVGCLVHIVMHMASLVWASILYGLFLYMFSCMVVLYSGSWNFYVFKTGSKFTDLELVLSLQFLYVTHTQVYVQCVSLSARTFLYMNHI